MQRLATSVNWNVREMQDTVTSLTLGHALSFVLCLCLIPWLEEADPALLLMQSAGGRAETADRISHLAEAIQPSTINNRKPAQECLRKGALTKNAARYRELTLS